MTNPTPEAVLSEAPHKQVKQGLMRMAREAVGLTWSDRKCLGEAIGLIDAALAGRPAVVGAEPVAWQIRRLEERSANGKWLDASERGYQSALNYPDVWEARALVVQPSAEQAGAEPPEGFFPNGINHLHPLHTVRTALQYVMQALEEEHGDRDFEHECAMCQAYREARNAFKLLGIEPDHAEQAGVDETCPNCDLPNGYPPCCEDCPQHDLRAAARAAEQAGAVVAGEPTDEQLREIFDHFTVNRLGAPFIKATRATFPALARVIIALATTHAGGAAQQGASTTERFNPAADSLKTELQMALVIGLRDEQDPSQAEPNPAPAPQPAEKFDVEALAASHGYSHDPAFYRGAHAARALASPPPQPASAQTLAEAMKNGLAKRFPNDPPMQIAQPAESVEAEALIVQRVREVVRQWQEDEMRDRSFFDSDRYYCRRAIEDCLRAATQQAKDAAP